jgi:hypothetical protein
VLALAFHPTNFLFNVPQIDRRIAPSTMLATFIRSDDVKSGRDLRCIEESTIRRLRGRFNVLALSGECD